MPRQRTPKRGSWRAIALSLLLHAGIVAAAVYGWFTWKHRPPPPEVMAIEGSVIDERALRDIAPPPDPKPAPPEPEPEPQPEPPPPEEQGPPKPDPAELERKREEEARLEAEQQKAAEEEKAREQERLDAQKKEAERVEAEKQAAEKRAAEKKRAEEAAAAKKAAEEKARLAREAELRRSLAAEERARALRGSEEANRWYAQIVARIQRAWIRPPSAQPGITCIVSVSQVPGGEVTSVRVNSCSIADPALRESVEAAVYRASPLPSPPDPALFERNLELTFAPQ